MAPRNPVSLFLLASFFIVPISAIAETETGLVRIESTCVDPAAIGYGTFQSHNKKVLQNGAGIFMTHIRSRNEAYTAQCWRLLRSVDGGTTFSIVYEATRATNPPVIETDRQDNIFLILPDWSDGNAYLYRFLAREEFKHPHITPIPGGAAGKFCAEIDLDRGRLYYFDINNLFHTLDLEGKVLTSYPITQSGKSAGIQYPHLYLSEEGILYAAWTTQKHGVYLYWDIHVIQSRDGGTNWETLNGTRLELPIVADDGGPADRITTDNEFPVHTWLANFIEKDNFLHFFYMAQFDPARMNYVRYDLARQTLIRIPPEIFRGETIVPLNLDGFFATDRDQPRSTLYCVTRSENRIVCIASDDNGDSWRDYASSEAFRNPYSIGGLQEVTADGYILGSFTDQATDANPSSSVYFFKFKIPVDSVDRKG